jgi:hypothetical protein
LPARTRWFPHGFHTRWKAHLPFWWALLGRLEKHTRRALGFSILLISIFALPIADGSDRPWYPSSHVYQTSKNHKLLGSQFVQSQ